MQSYSAVRISREGTTQYSQSARKNVALWESTGWPPVPTCTQDEAVPECSDLLALHAHRYLRQDQPTATAHEQTCAGEDARSRFLLACIRVPRGRAPNSASRHATPCCGLLWRDAFSGNPFATPPAASAPGDSVITAPARRAVLPTTLGAAQEDMHVKPGPKFAPPHAWSSAAGTPYCNRSMPSQRHILKGPRVLEGCTCWHALQRERAEDRIQTHQMTRQWRNSPGTTQQRRR